MDQAIDLSALRGLVRETPCRILVGFAETLGRQLQRGPSASMIWAAAALAYEQGADGFGLCDGMWTPHGWPWTAEDYQTLRLLGHPELLATADKLYLAHSLPRDSKKEELFPTAGPVLPRALTQGQPLDVPLPVADDLSRWHGEGRVASVRLRVRLTNFEHTLDEVRVALNGRLLPEAILRKIDLHYRVLQNTMSVGPYGYIFEYRLPVEYFPKRGRNVVRVELVKRDPHMKPPVEVYDVDCAIAYQLHRHFEQEPIDY
jgi:hypothetical protein